jgi:DNA mismatch repair protein MLH3
MAQIRHIDDSICSKLQSQTKIRSLSDVIRELVQNGVDADADNIKIKLRVNFPERLIELEYIDNGIGIDPQSLENFGKRFYSSKLNFSVDNSENEDESDVDKLNILKNLKTFGFRGEAMSSLRSVCNTMIVISRVKQYNSAFKVCFAGNLRIGNVLKTNSISPVGTTIKIVGLFDPIVIRKNILLDNLEKSWIEDTFEIKKCILDSLIDHPLIKIEIIKHELKDSKWITRELVKNYNNTGVERVPFQYQMRMFNNVFGGKICEDYENCKVQFNDFQLKAGISISTTQTKKYQFIYLNGRPFYNNELLKFINQLFQKHYELWGHNIKDNKSIKKGNMYGRPFSVNPIFIASFRTPIEIFELIQDPSKICFTSKNIKILQLLFKKVVDVYFGIFQRHKKKRDKRELARLNLSDKEPVEKKRKIINDSILLKSKIRISKFKDLEITGRITTNCTENADNEPENKVFDLCKIHEGLKLKVKEEEEEEEEEEREGITKIARPIDKYLECEDCVNIPLSQGEIKNQSEYFNKQEELDLVRGDIAEFEIIGQVENKFILVKYRNKIIGLDQHASDERVKLEKVYTELITDCINGKFHQLIEHIQLQFSKDDIELIKKYKETLEFWGMKFQLEDANDSSALVITSLPQLIFNKVDKVNIEILQKGVIEYMINLQEKSKRIFRIETEHDNFNTTFPFWWQNYVGHMPALYKETIKSKACRTAVMFGQSLCHQEQYNLVHSLMHCYQPFQCAHGRPSLYPLCVLH